MVFAAIHEAGLDAYYARRPEAPGRAAELPREMAWLNQPDVQASYVACADGIAEASFLLDGLHCAACSWLVEKSVERLDGVQEARVNYATSRLRVRWREGVSGVGDVAQCVAHIGYRATPFHPHRLERPRQRQSNDLVLRMAVAGFCAGNVMLAAAALYCGALDGMAISFRRFFDIVGLVLSLPVVLYAALPFYRGALSSLRARSMTMDVPICIGLLTTWAYSVWAAVTTRGEVYFDTVAMFVFVLLVGRVLENASRGRVSSAVERLLALGARSARRVRDGERFEVPVDEVVPGDVVEVWQGERIPVDGKVLSGGAWVDASMLTGEPAPRAVEAGSDVSAGTVCTDGQIALVATRTGASTTLARISRLVEEAQMRRAPVQRAVDRFSRVFVAVTLGLSLLTWLWWHARGAPNAVLIAVSVLIITCPCALGLATPLAVACACGRGASRGLLFRGGDVLESLNAVTHVLLDKTGTITEGRLAVTECFTLDGLAVDEALSIAAAVEHGSLHPVARALRAEARGDAPEAFDIEQTPGLGVRARVADRDVRLGSAELMRRVGLALPDALTTSANRCATSGATIIWLALDGRVRAAFALRDQIRPEAPEVVRSLRALGLEVELVSGDGRGAVEMVARAAGIARSSACMLPLDKADRVRALQRQGARVLLVGDGINDAPGLSVADVGLAVSSGTDVAMEAADVVCLRAGLVPIIEVLVTARRTFRVIRDNMTLSALYNAAALPTAMAGWVAPLLAAVAMPLSSLAVVASSMRLWRADDAEGRSTISSAEEVG